MVPWNLTRRRQVLREADVIIVSPGKAGRTWLRVLINKYLSLHYGTPFSVRDLYRDHPLVPAVVFKHWLWAHLRGSPWWDRVRGKNIIPRQLLFQKKIIVQVRDPRDVMVSAYFHQTRRAQSGEHLNLSMSQFIRHPLRGVGKLIEVMNVVHAVLRGHPQCLTVTYESLRADTAAEVTRILRFIGIAQPNPVWVAEAVSFSDIDNMKKMEQRSEFGSVVLQPRDPSDPQSFKVRKGKVGGYVEHFNAADLTYIEQHISALHPDYGYGNVRANAGKTYE